MSSLKVISDRQADNALTVTVRIPPRRNGDANVACLTRIVSDLHTVSPDAYDAPEVPAAQLAHNDGHTADGGGIVAHDIAVARMRDMLHDQKAWPHATPADDDEGAPGEPPRCKTGGCDGD